MFSDRHYSNSTLLHDGIIQTFLDLSEVADKIFISPPQVLYVNVSSLNTLIFPYFQRPDDYLIDGSLAANL